MSEAIEQYRSYRRLLWTELGIEPTDELCRLVIPLSRRLRALGDEGRAVTIPTSTARLGGDCRLPDQLAR